MASDIIQNWAFAEQKTVAATISIHAYTPTLPKTPRAPSAPGPLDPPLFNIDYFTLDYITTRGVDARCVFNSA